ncbi:MAG: hypothetical protein SVR94_00965 [Pseudomonadota bacterium]|nr:hypothetical protein [Pseudomonadota bacterium]
MASPFMMRFASSAHPMGSLQPDSQVARVGWVNQRLTQHKHANMPKMLGYATLTQLTLLALNLDLRITDIDMLNYI